MLQRQVASTANGLSQIRQRTLPHGFPFLAHDSGLVPPANVDCGRFLPPRGGNVASFLASHVGQASSSGSFRHLGRQSIGESSLLYFSYTYFAPKSKAIQTGKNKLERLVGEKCLEIYTLFSHNMNFP